MTHPTQGLLDMYTALRALKKPFEDMRIIISTPDLSRARSGQSFALGAARMVLTSSTPAQAGCGPRRS